MMLEMEELYEMAVEEGEGSHHKLNDDEQGNVDGNNINVVSKEKMEEVENHEKQTLNVEHEKEEFTASVYMQNNEAVLTSEQGVGENNEAGLASEQGVEEMFTISGDIKDESLTGDSRNQDIGDSKDLESLTDKTTMNEKEETMNDDTNATKEVLLVPKKKVLKKKKVVKRRKLVKRNVAVAKDEENKSEMPGLSVEARSNQNRKNDEDGDGKTMDNVIKSTAVKTKKKNAPQMTDMVAVKSKQSEKNKQAGKEKMASESENMDDMKEGGKSETGVMLNKLIDRKDEKGNVVVTAEDKDEAEPSEQHKSSNKVESMGVIFMCSSKTRDDCYRYKILGLPASKKDLVLKIYKGMRLFLFDVELRVLLGIYKAAAPGGYNIEPNAFKSNFPSQVRFTIVHEYTPLPEEKFKKVIKDNYYSKNKFHCELNSNQVKSLCKLFRVANKGANSKVRAITERPKVGIRHIVDRENKKRERTENNDLSRNNRRVVVGSDRGDKRRRIVDDLKRSRANGDPKPFRTKDDVRRARGKRDVNRHGDENDRRRIRLEDDARRRIRLEDDARRRIRLEDDARRRIRLEDDARRHLRFGDEVKRLQLEDDARRSRVENEARRARLEDEERRLRLEDDERRLRLEDDERRLRLEDEERCLRLEDEERHLRLVDEERRIRVEDDIRRLLADDRRRADIYERDAYLPSALPVPLHLNVLPPPAAPLYTSSYTERPSVLDGHRLDRGTDLEDRGLGYSRSRSLYEIESRDPYLPYREHVDYRDPAYDVNTRQSYHSPAASRDEYLPSTSNSSRYRRY